MISPLNPGQIAETRPGSGLPRRNRLRADSHPEDSDISALAHILGDRRTISETQGIFLAETRRLHPSICRFTSELFYEGRLLALNGLERQAIQATAPFAGAGLWFVPVAYQGNQSHSVEEIERIAELVQLLTQDRATWTDREGRQWALTLDEILIVAPYNDIDVTLTARIRSLPPRF